MEELVAEWGWRRDKGYRGLFIHSAPVRILTLRRLYRDCKQSWKATKMSADFLLILPVLSSSI